MKPGAIIDGGSAATGRFHCENCGLFLRTGPNDWTVEHGVDVEMEFDGEITRTGWTAVTEYRTCKGCDYVNTRDGDWKDYR